MHWLLLDPCGPARTVALRVLMARSACARLVKAANANPRTRPSSPLGSVSSHTKPACCSAVRTLASVACVRSGGRWADDFGFEMCVMGSVGSCMERASVASGRAEEGSPVCSTTPTALIQHTRQPHSTPRPHARAPEGTHTAASGTHECIHACFSTSTLWGAHREGQVAHNEPPLAHVRALSRHLARPQRHRLSFAPPRSLCRSCCRG